MTEDIKRPIRCAIYTRKSTSEGLEQEFTTLDAQREACENYILAQKNEGWSCLETRYDDGGFTGANIARPALSRLIADIKEGRINCVVVYKVDRLSRSLSDFVGLLGLFERHSVAFVSVTQAFNTNSSMGRLTLNILLSFAQFERELISERVRDKMSAARRKGRFLGGLPMLGYDIDTTNHRLVINPKEAALVREIFELYIRERSLLAVTKSLNDRAIMTKAHISQAGNTTGGILFKKTIIQKILRSLIYTGKIRYKAEVYVGLHERIISDEVFNAAGQVLDENRRNYTGRPRAKSEGLLNRLLKCKACTTTMYHTYSQKGIYRYRYYVCSNAQKRGYSACPTRSISAPVIEEAVLEALRAITPSPPSLECLKLIADPVWESLFPKEKRRILHLILKEVDYDAKTGAFGLTLNDGGLKLLKSQMQQKQICA